MQSLALNNGSVVTWFACLSVGILSAGAPIVARGDEPMPTLTVATTRFGSLNLMNIDIQGKNAVQVTKDPKGAVGPTWSPDGKRLAYISYRDGAGQIFAMNADGSGDTNLSKGKLGDRNPVWSPDGKKIAFCSSRSGREEVWVMNADGSEPVNVTNQNKFEADPAWSPDGKRLAIVSNRVGVMRLWLINADGFEPVDLLKRDQIGAIYPTWSADGQQIVFGQQASGGRVHLHVINVDGTGLQQLTSGGDKSCSYAAWSPDGQYIAYVRFVSWPNSLQPEENREDRTPPADLMIYNTLDETHTVVSAGNISMWGPRPAWRPQPAKAEK